MRPIQLRERETAKAGEKCRNQLEETRGWGPEYRGRVVLQLYPATEDRKGKAIKHLENIKNILIHILHLV